jgi:hypothetical protein
MFQVGAVGLKLVISHRRKSLIVNWLANDMASAGIRIPGGGETSQDQNVGPGAGVYGKYIVYVLSIRYIFILSLYLTKRNIQIGVYSKYAACFFAFQDANFLRFTVLDSALCCK